MHGYYEQVTNHLNNQIINILQPENLPQPCENGGREEGAAPGITLPPEHNDNPN